MEVRLEHCRPVRFPSRSRSVLANQYRNAAGFKGDSSRKTSYQPLPASTSLLPSTEKPTIANGTDMTVITGIRGGKVKAIAVTNPEMAAPATPAAPIVLPSSRYISSAVISPLLVLQAEFQHSDRC